MKFAIKVSNLLSLPPLLQQDFHIVVSFVSLFISIFILSRPQMKTSLNVILIGETWLKYISNNWPAGKKAPSRDSHHHFRGHTDGFSHHKIYEEEKTHKKWKKLLQYTGTYIPTNFTFSFHHTFKNFIKIKQFFHFFWPNFFFSNFF